MITSIFNKSKPINFLVVFFITLLAFVISRWQAFGHAVTLQYVIKQVVLILVIYTSILLLNFIVTKNSLTLKSNYEILLFSLFLLFITQTTKNANIIVSNFFILLTLRRLMSLRTPKDIKKKLFDAAFWIAIASLFYFWAILFFVLIVLSLFLYSDNNLRHWIVPFLGVLVVFIIMSVVSVVLHDNFFIIFNMPPKVSYDYSHYNSASYIIGITLLISFGIWSSFFYLKNIKKKKKSFRVAFKIIIIAAVIGFFMVLLVPEKSGSEFLFLFAPLAIIIANYIEIIQEKWFKEVFVSVLLITPFILLLL
ncbi:DUF6427 family protein [uncultured Algibacter sp.]|uniref:DUF6427 family protein n=1 Tax=uncultured Algibacter sp. TaxID=298659 RepID=UPI003216976A